MAEAKIGLHYGQPIHYSVGALIEQKGQVLLIDRASPPFGLAGPAGHIDDDERPEEAIIREVKEETGLKVVKHKLVIEEFVSWNECSKNVRGHHWYVFRCEAGGKLKTSDPEYKSIDWYPLNELVSLNLEPVWEYWFKKLGGL